jgi:hypothetical protein
MKKYSIVFCSLIIAIYMLAGRNYIFSDFEKDVKISKNSLYSSTIALDHLHTFSWKIKNHDWDYQNGIAEISLVFNRSQSEGGDEYWEKTFPLKVKVDAYAETENNVKATRLIKNYFFPSDEPMAKEAKLWSGWSDEKLEYPLGSVMRFPKEDLIIELTVQVPDPILNKANPRLKIVGDYDPAILGFAPFAKVLRDISLIACLLALFFITRRALLNGKER